MIEAHPIPFRGMVLLRKCLESHHSSKLSDELPCEGERRAKIDFGPKVRRDLGEVDFTVAKGDRESSPSLERQKVLSQEDQGPPETCIF